MKIYRFLGIGWFKIPRLDSELAKAVHKLTREEREINYRRIESWLDNYDYPAVPTYSWKARI